jgi:hypothetical protein
MVMQLDKVVPFGRSLAEYSRMFALSESDFNRDIVGIGDGPASFNAEMSALGKSVVSVDPIYEFSAQEIEQQFYAVVDNIIEQIKTAPDSWVWSYHTSPEHLKENRINTLKCFVADYGAGKLVQRYRTGALPSLDFTANQFQLALCSHFLFLYSEQLTYEFHRDAILEMLRIAPEVRIFPIMTLKLEPSPYLAPLMAELTDQGFVVSIETVDYEFQKGGNQMVRILQSKPDL